MFLTILVSVFIGIFITMAAGLAIGQWALLGAGHENEAKYAAQVVNKVAMSYRAESLLSMLWHMPPEMTIQETHCKALETYGEDAYDECCRLFDQPEDRQGGE